MSSVLTAAATVAAMAGSPLVLVATKEIPNRVTGRADRSLGAALHFFLRARLLSPFEELGQTLGVVVLDVEPVDRFGEAEIRVDSGHDDPGVDGQQLDADQRHPDVRVDDQAL